MKATLSFNPQSEIRIPQSNESALPIRAVIIRVAENLVDSSGEGGKNMPPQAVPEMPGASSHPAPQRAARLHSELKNHVGRKEVNRREFHYRWEYDLNASPQALW